MAYELADGRKVKIIFEETSPTQTKIMETFDPESDNTHELQKNGWQAILDHYKKYAERI